MSQYLGYLIVGSLEPFRRNHYGLISPECGEEENIYIQRNQIYSQETFGIKNWVRHIVTLQTGFGTMSSLLQINEYYTTKDLSKH